MDKNKLLHYKQLLEEQKKNRLESLNDDAFGYKASLQESTKELSTYDNHPGDLGTETFEAEKNLSFRNNDKNTINEVEAALDKIKNGTYGTCEGCKKDIMEERLELIPYARYCIDCEEEKERHQVKIENERPIEEQLLYPPFGRTDKDNSPNDEIGFDGEDAWESVADYNSRTYSAEDEHNGDRGYVEDVEQISNQQYKNQL